MKRNVAKAGASWEPGVTTVAMRKHLAELRVAAVALIPEQAAQERRLERVAQFETLAREVAVVNRISYGMASPIALENGHARGNPADPGA